jgi:hypothetical protein
VRGGTAVTPAGPEGANRAFGQRSPFSAPSVSLLGPYHAERARRWLHQGRRGPVLPKPKHDDGLTEHLGTRTGPAGSSTTIRILRIMSTWSSSRRRRSRGSSGNTSPTTPIENSSVTFCKIPRRERSSPEQADSASCGGRTSVAGRGSGRRVIYYYFASDGQVWLITIYDKDEIQDLSPAEKRTLKAAIEAETRRRSRRSARR